MYNLGTTKISSNPKQGRGKSKKLTCPECKKHYLVTAYIHKSLKDSDITQKWRKIGMYCIGCKYFVGDGDSDCQQES